MLSDLEVFVQTIELPYQATMRRNRLELFRESAVGLLPPSSVTFLSFLVSREGLSTSSSCLHMMICKYFITKMLVAKEGQPATESSREKQENQKFGARRVWRFSASSCWLLFIQRARGGLENSYLEVLRSISTSFGQFGYVLVTK